MPLVEAALNFSIRYTDNIARDEDAKLAQHREVLDAILARDADLAYRTAEKLLLDARELMEKGLEPASGLTSPPFQCDSRVTVSPDFPTSTSRSQPTSGCIT